MKDIQKAIYALYPNVVTINNTTAFDKDGNEVSIDMNAVNNWNDPEQYKIDRALKYPLVTDQLDMLYHDIKNNNISSGTWIQAIEAIKTKYPKD